MVIWIFVTKIWVAIKNAIWVAATQVSAIKIRGCVKTWYCEYLPVKSVNCCWFLECILKTNQILIPITVDMNDSEAKHIHHELCASMKFKWREIEHIFWAFRSDHRKRNKKSENPLLPAFGMTTRQLNSLLPHCSRNFSGFALKSISQICVVVTNWTGVREDRVFVAISEGKLFPYVFHLVFFVCMQCCVFLSPKSTVSRLVGKNRKLITISALACSAKPLFMIIFLGFVGIMSTNLDFNALIWIWSFFFFFCSCVCGMQFWKSHQ